MKLRNKKTGEIVTFVTLEEIYDDELDFTYIKKSGNENELSYSSLKKFNDEWEDYVPKEPLIKDEKIRKAVRAWAEANGIGGCICKEEIHCITFETERGMFISFENADPIPPEGNFTIAELCGEEEE